MLRIGTISDLNPDEVVEKAAAFFGKGGMELEIASRTPDSIRFQGGGGMVDVSAVAKQKETAVDVVSQEWDNQVKEFLRKIARRP